MTQTPTDALRLVPVKATPQQLETAAFNLSAEIGAAEAMKLGPHIERAYELLVAAAPASPLPGGGDEALIAELKEARECLHRFEWSCEQLARTRSQASYDQMISDGQAQELLELDNARRAARAFLARNGKGEG